MYNKKTALALRSLGYEDDIDFTCKAVVGGVEVDWKSADDIPTEAAIVSALSSQEFLDWEAENGGDPVLTKRKRIKAAFQSDEGRLLLAFIIAMKKPGIISGTKAQILKATMAEVDLGEAD